MVREAAARVGMTEQSAHWLRRRADATSFGLAWEAALRIGADRLRSIAYERAVNGTVKRTYYQGKVVGEDRVYNDRLLIYLLGKAEPIADPSGVAKWSGTGKLDAGDRGRARQAAAQARSAIGRRSGRPRTAAGGPAFRRRPASTAASSSADGEDEYRRECTLDEIAAIEAADARRAAEQDRRRDLYFNPDKMTFSNPPLAEKTENSAAFGESGPAL